MACGAFLLLHLSKCIPNRFAYAFRWIYSHMEYGHDSLMNTDSISPCPFCASEQVASIEVDLAQWAVVCNSCGSVGPTMESLRESIDAWNGRQVLAQNLGLIRHA